MTRGPFKKEELDNIKNDTFFKNQYKFNILFLWMSWKFKQKNGTLDAIANES
jgi:hypothetical protein